MAAPHDHLFRYLFGLPSRAEALLRHNLPPSLVAAVDWATLRRESGTLVEWGRETRKDLLFSARYRNAHPLQPPHFFLVEHQSRVQRDMALRVHGYSWRQTTHWREANPHNRWIPEITPLVVYPRKGERWWAPLSVEEHYWVPAEVDGPREIRSRYRVDDLSLQSDEEVMARAGPPLVPLGLLVLSWAGREELAHRLWNWRELFAGAYADPYGEWALYRIVRYVHQRGDEAASQAMRGVLHSIMKAQRAEALMRTMEEILKERGRQEGLLKGRQEGLLKGRQEGRQEGLLEGQAQGLAKALFRLLAARGLRVDAPSRQRIQECRDVATLEHWLERAVVASHLSEVFEGH